MKDGVPDPKLATLSLLITDSKGNGKFLAASVDINFSNHFGDQFSAGTATLTPTNAS